MSLSDADITRIARVVRALNQADAPQESTSSPEIMRLRDSDSTLYGRIDEINRNMAKHEGYHEGLQQTLERIEKKIETDIDENKELRDRVKELETRWATIRWLGSLIGGGGAVAGLAGVAGHFLN